MTRAVLVRACTSVAVTWVSIACTWTRFDDIAKDPPVEQFDIPENLAGVGRTVTTFETTTGTNAGVTNQNKVVLYELGTGVNPSRTASTTQSCPGNASCVLAQRLAGLRPSALLGNYGCIAYGIGNADANSSTAGAQVWLICENSRRRSLPAPAGFTEWFAANRVNSNTVVTFGTTRRGQVTPLVTAVPDAAAVWFYDGSDPTPVLLPALPDGNTAGRSLAVIAVDSGYVILAGSVSRDQVIWLYRVGSDRSASLAGCIEGATGFGRLMSTGQFDDDTVDDLATTDTTDNRGVVMLRGSDIVSIANDASTSCVSIDTLETLGRAQCAQLPDLDGCAGTPWAVDLATGNLDGMGPDELIVGAPNTSVRGEASAGAVFIHAKGNDTWHVAQGLYVSTASNGQLLGSSVAVAHVSSIDTILAGAPGDNAVMAFYCNSLIPAQLKSARCP